MNVAVGVVFFVFFTRIHVILRESLKIFTFVSEFILNENNWHFNPCMANKNEAFPAYIRSVVLMEFLFIFYFIKCNVLILEAF